MDSVGDNSSSFVPPNSSFQNYPSSSRPVNRPRKRGISTVLQDCTNQPLQKRSSKVKAEASLHEMLTTSEYAPRGNPVAGSTARHQQHSEVERVEEANADDTHVTLCSVFRKNKTTFTKHAEQLLGFIQRNASYEIQKAVAISLMATAMIQCGENITEAAETASKYTMLSKETIRKWTSSYFSDMITTCPEYVTDEVIEQELSSERGRGHSSPSSLIHDEEFQLSARKYVREHSYVKGEPNLTILQFTEWVKTTYDIEIHPETGRRWLHELGFSRVHHQKGVYFDGHDRQDVTAYRNSFLARMAEYDKRSITFDGIVPQLQEGERPLIRVVHDESTFNANCDQSYFWGDEGTNVLRQKSLGAGIMVSDFIDEVSGYVRLEDKSQEARLYLETQKEGYFNNDHLLQQVEHTIDIFEKIHQNTQGLFLFDNAPSHKKQADDSLNVEKMNVNPGGVQPAMRSTMWDGKIQTMVKEDGTPKGMKAVLQERGVDVKGMKAQDMRAKLKTYPDFANPKTLLEDLVESRGHICEFYPKYHCELSPIELVWCQAKKYTRAYANGSIVRLRTLVPEGLDSVQTELIKKFFRKCRDYEKAYREGHTGKAIEQRVKVYKSHRRVQGIT